MEPDTSQKKPDESPKVPIPEDNEREWRFRNPNNNVDRSPWQNSTPKEIEILKPGLVIKCKLVSDTDSEWRKLNVISMTGKATSKDKNLMNRAMKQGEPFWLDFEQWQRSEVHQTKHGHSSSDGENTMISSSDDDLEGTRKKELQSWVENKVYIQVSRSAKISVRLIFTNKSSNGK